MAGREFERGTRTAGTATATARGRGPVGPDTPIGMSGIAGATVLVGLEGYGETAEMHRAHFARSATTICAS